MKSMGRKHRPFFRICAIDSRKARDGRPIEEFGTYDPMVTVKSDRAKIDLARYDYWISVGATPSDKVKVLVKKIRTNRFGTAMAPPEAIAPKPVAEPVEAEGEGEAETTEEATES
jgi:small subunit ribosomal protein S16